jgi:hypothetical protein
MRITNRFVFELSWRLSTMRMNNERIPCLGLGVTTWSHFKKI